MALWHCSLGCQCEDHLIIRNMSWLLTVTFLSIVNSLLLLYGTFTFLPVPVLPLDRSGPEATDRRIPPDLSHSTAVPLLSTFLLFQSIDSRYRVISSGMIA